MGLFRRIGDIISANLNDMVEGFESPEKMLKQAIREMEESITAVKQEVVGAMASETLVRKSLQDNERQAGEWYARAEQALRGGDEALARKALTRKQEYDRVAGALRDQLSAATEASGILRRQLEAMQAKLAEARRKLGTLAARQRAAEVRARMQAEEAALRVDTGAFEKFERLREKVDRAEAEADALRELEGGRRDLPDEDLASGSPGTPLDAELAELKKKLGR